MKKISQKTIQKFKEGDKDSFEDIFYYYKDKVYHFAYHYVKDHDDADDCVQEVFIKLVNSIETYDEVSAQFETWFYLLSKRVILNFLRTQSRHRNHFYYDEEILEKLKQTKQVEDKVVIRKLPTISCEDKEDESKKEEIEETRLEIKKHIKEGQITISKLMLFRQPYPSLRLVFKREISCYTIAKTVRSLTLRYVII